MTFGQISFVKKKKRKENIYRSPREITRIWSKTLNTRLISGLKVESAIRIWKELLKYNKEIQPRRTVKINNIVIYLFVYLFRVCVVYKRVLHVEEKT